MFPCFLRHQLFLRGVKRHASSVPLFLTSRCQSGHWGRFTRHCLREISHFDCPGCGRWNRVGPKSNFFTAL